MPKPITFHVIETMIAHSDRLASTPSQSGGLLYDPEIHEDAVDEAVVAGKQPEPEKARHSEADDHRHEDDAAREPLQERVLSREQGENVAADHENGREYDRVFEREAERHPEAFVAEGLVKVVEAYVFGRLEQRPVGKADPEHLDERVGREHRDEQDCRREIQPSDQGTLSGGGQGHVSEVPDAIHLRQLLEVLSSSAAAASAAAEMFPATAAYSAAMALICAFMSAMIVSIGSLEK